MAAFVLGGDMAFDFAHSTGSEVGLFILFLLNIKKDMVAQYEFQLPPHPRGFHLITRKVLAQIPTLPVNGIFHLFIKHTSAGLTINENADPDVRIDFEQVFNRRIMPEHEPYLVHTIEGPDDMPAHIKSTLVGASISIPITDGRLNLGTWQGIYLCEFRNHGGGRKLVATIYS